MIIVVTYLFTKFKKIKKHWKKCSALRNKGIFGTNRPVGRNVDLGGMIVKIDWNSKRILSSKELRSPSSFDFKDSLFYVASMRDNEIYVLDKKFNLLGKIQNKYFNDIHSLNITKKGFLITSTGLDLILEINQKGEAIWTWWAVDQEYNKDQYGNIRKINKNIDYRKVDFPTLFHTTHVNSAIYCDRNEKKILASLFHQRVIIEIDKNTLTSKIILTGLKQPHSIHRIEKNKFLVSDTNNQQVIIFNRKKKKIKTIFGKFNWIQDAIKLSSGNFLIADSNHQRIVEMTEKGKIIRRFNYSPNYKIFQIKEIEIN